MRYKLLGRSGLRVSELCLGAMTFGTPGWGSSDEECRRIFDTFLAAGGNFVDTANRYGGGNSERILGDLLASERDRIVLATKYSASMRSGDPNSGGNHRKSLIQSLDASLKRLKTDYIDVYWVHAWEFLTPLDEVMRALDDCVRAGKILYVGLSDAPAWIAARANTLAELRGWTPFVAIQIEYSLIERTVERELVPMARALDLAVLAWGPLGGGLLTGKYATNGDRPQGRLSGGDRRLTERNLAIAAAAAEIGSEIGAPPAQVALAWLRAQPGVVIPIVGSRTADQLAETLASVDLELDAAHLRRLDEASRIPLGFPHDLLLGMGRRDTVTGGTMGAVDDHRRSSPWSHLRSR
jgi:aryl-alcohol dehydrogenase-like predicted oxidoreductase